MTAYAQELRRCQVVLFLRAVIDAGGNQKTAAKALGVHRNTVQRVLRGAGYDVLSLHRLTRIHAARRKPVQPAPPADAERRVA